LTTSAIITESAEQFYDIGQEVGSSALEQVEKTKNSFQSAAQSFTSSLGAAAANVMDLPFRAAQAAKETVGLAQPKEDEGAESAQALAEEEPAKDEQQLKEEESTQEKDDEQPSSAADDQVEPSIVDSIAHAAAKAQELVSSSFQAVKEEAKQLTGIAADDDQQSPADVEKEEEETEKEDEQSEVFRKEKAAGFEPSSTKRPQQSDEVQEEGEGFTAASADEPAAKSSAAPSLHDSSFESESEQPATVVTMKTKMMPSGAEGDEVADVESKEEAAAM
jgi:hypothetical protein